MTTRVRLHNLSDTETVIVKEVERDSPHDDALSRVVAQHELEPGQSVEIHVWGWRHYLAVYEAAHP